MGTYQGKHVSTRDEDLVKISDMAAMVGERAAAIRQEVARLQLQEAQDGYVILPPMLTFYNGCETTADQVDHIIGKVLMQFGIEYQRFRPWRG